MRNTQEADADEQPTPAVQSLAAQLLATMAVQLDTVGPGEISGIVRDTACDAAARDLFRHTAGRDLADMIRDATETAVAALPSLHTVETIAAYANRVRAASARLSSAAAVDELLVLVQQLKAETRRTGVDIAHLVADVETACDHP